MPETRGSTAETVATLTVEMADVKTMLHEQKEETARNSATCERMISMMENLQASMKELKQSAPRVDKQPMYSPQNQAPLLPTPQTPLTGTTASGSRPRFDQQQTVVWNAPLELQENYANAGLRLPRVEVPMFSGDEVDCWIYQLERYFKQHNTPSDQKVATATYFMSGEALRWLQFMDTSHQLSDWSSFTRDLLARFGPGAFWNAEFALSKLRQTTSVTTYVAAFESLATRTPGLTASNLLQIFLAGLKDDIHSEIVLLCPQTLRIAMEMARVAERKLHAQRAVSTWKSPAPRNNVGVSPVPTGYATPNKDIHTRAALPIKKLTAAEMATRRERGLCFNCDEKFAPGHKCRPKFQCLIIEEEEEHCDGEECCDEPIVCSPQEEEQEAPNISFHALQGRLAPSTLRMEGQLNGCKVLVLIDSGSTHNFLQTRVAKHAGLVIEPAKHLSVTIGNGDEMRCEGMCRKVHLNLGEHTFDVNFHLLPIYGADAVLGVQWLAEVGPALFDYTEMWMGIEYQGKTVRLHGLQPKTQFGQLTLGQLKRATHAKSIACCYEMTVEVEGASSQHSQDKLPVIPMELDVRRKHELTEVLHEFANVFMVPHGLPPKRPCDHRIPLLPGTPPVSVRPYRYPRYQKFEIERLIREMLSDGIIRQSNSPFSSPVLLVKKKDGSWRFCVDYRALNAATVRDRFPIPTVDELFDELHGAEVFSKLDLRSGYHQVRMNEDDVHKTAFRTHDGHYEFLVMPFGLTNAPSTFQSAMNDMFRPVLRKFVLVFMDDILIYSASWKEHMQHLRVVMSLLAENAFVAKASKCEVAKPRIQYLGHVISGVGMEVDQEKVEAVKRWPYPTNVKQLRGFLGLTGYYRRFVPHYAQIVSPLTCLLRKDAFVWGKEATAAFDCLKIKLTSTPILALPDFTKEFTVETDASGMGMGAVLSQEGHPIAYFSKQFTPTLQRSSTYNRELAAVVMAVQKWRQYLLGGRFVIQTDHQPLRTILTQSINTPEQQKWLSKLMGFEFVVLYKPGKENSSADALSRANEGVYLGMTGVSKPVHGLLRALRRVFLEGEVGHALLQKVQTQPIMHEHFQVRDGLVMYKGRLFVPEDIVLKELLLHEYHATPIGGHVGIRRTTARVASNFYWPNMRKDIEAYVNECEICQQVKALNTAPPGLLQPLPIPTQVWSDISMDFVTHLPRSGGKTVIMVVVDRLSKYAHFCSLPTGFTAESVAAAFVREICRLHGVPTSIVSDRDPIFMSAFWQALFQSQGTVLAHSSAYHPQSDGQTEVVNRVLEDYLRCFVAENQLNWAEYLSWAEFHFNTALHSGTKFSPFEAVYGRPPPAMTDYVPGETKVAAVESLLSRRTELIKQLRANLERAQHRMIQQANKRRTDVEYAIDDWVFVRLQPYRQTSIKNHRSHKLAKRYYGPFRITERVGKVAYRLELPEESRIHDVFHVSNLKSCKAKPPFLKVSWPTDFQDNHPILLPDRVLDSRKILRRGSAVPQILVQWQGQQVEDATWEDLDMFMADYPNFALEDEVVSQEGSNDTTVRVHQVREGARQRSKSKRYPEAEYELARSHKRHGDGG